MTRAIVSLCLVGCALCGLLSPASAANRAATRRIQRPLPYILNRVPAKNPGQRERIIYRDRDGTVKSVWVHPRTGNVTDVKPLDFSMPVPPKRFLPEG